MSRFFYKFAFLLAALLLPTACSDDDTPIASYHQDLAELLTNSAGYATTLVTDAGDTLAITNADTWRGLTADSVYRVQTLYLLNDGGAELTQAASLFAPRPQRFDTAKIVRDPLTLDAAWRGGRYLNLLVSIKSAGGSHGFAFADLGTDTLASGSRLLRLELVHQQGADPLYYTRQAYLSCPLWATDLQAGDSVEITVNTFDGAVTRRFAR